MESTRHDIESGCDFAHIIGDGKHLSKSYGGTMDESFLDSTDDFWIPVDYEKDSSDTKNDENPSGNTFSTEGDLDFVDENGMLSFLSDTEKCGSIPFTGAVNVEAIDNFDVALNNTLNMIFESENKKEEDHCTSYQPGNDNTSVKLEKHANICDAETYKDFFQSSSQLEENSSAIDSIFNITSFHDFDISPEGEQYNDCDEPHQEHAFLKCDKENCATKEAHGVCGENDARDDFSDLQDLLTSDTANHSLETDSSGYTSSYELQGNDVFSCHDSLESNMSLSPVTQIDNYFGNLDYIPPNIRSNKDDVIGQNSSQENFEDKSPLDLLFLDEALDDNCVSPESVNQSLYDMTSCPSISQSVEVPYGYSLLAQLDTHKKALSYQSRSVEPINILHFINQHDTGQSLEIEAAKTKVKRIFRSDLVGAIGNNNNNNKSCNSDVVWTMQMPKPSVSPLHLNNNCIQMPEPVSSNDLIDVSKENDKMGALLVQCSARSGMKQEDQVLHHVMKESNIENVHLQKFDAINDCESILKETLTETKLKSHTVFSDADTNILPSEEISAISTRLVPQNSLDSPWQSEYLSFLDLVNLDSVFENNSSPSQFLTKEEGLACTVQEDISQSQSDAGKTSCFNQSLFDPKVDSDVIKGSYNIDDINSLLDSFIHNIDTGVGNPTNYVSPLSHNNNMNQNNRQSNSVLPPTCSDHTDPILDDFLRELNTSEDLLNGYGNRPSNEKQQIMESDEIFKANTVSDPAGQMSLPKKKKGTKSTIFQVHSANQNSNRYNMKGQRMKRNVSFKTRPAGKPIKCVVRGQVVENVLKKRPRTLRFVLDKERRLENQDGTTLWPKREDFNPDLFCSPQCTETKKSTNKNQNSDPRRELTEGHNNSSFILPVGETGLSITIPTNAPTNITSFLPSKSAECGPIISPILPCHKNETCVAKLVPVTMAKSTLFSSVPAKPNVMVQSRNVMQMINQHPVPLVKEKSICQVPLTPVSSAEPIYVVVPTVHTPQTKSTYSIPPSITTVVSCPLLPQGILNGPKWQTPVSSKQNFWTSHVHLIAPKVSQSSTSQCAPTKDSTVCSIAKVSDSVKIFINTKSKPLTKEVSTLKSSCSDEIRRKEKCTDEPRFRSEIVQSLQQNILKRKTHQESADKRYNKVLKDELRIRFPDIPETILSKLTIPPQAIHRGYFSMLDLQTLRTQALALRLRTIFREHVSNCIVRNCSVCIDFLRERQKLSWVEKEKHAAPRMLKKSRNIGIAGRCKPRGRGRRGGRARGSRVGEKDDPTYEPPHSYTSSKKKKTNDDKEVFDEERGKSPLKICTSECNNASAILKRFKRFKILYHTSKLRSCYSESNIHALTKSYDFRETSNNDDVYLYQNSSYLKCIRNIQGVKALALQDPGKRESTSMSLKCLYNYDQQDRKKQQSQMVKEALYDFSVKHQIDKSYCIPFCEGDVRRSKGSSPKPLYYDVHSLNIGPVKVLAKYEREFLPKLRVIFTARKFTYEYELMCGMPKNHEPDPCKVRSVSGGPRPQLLITIDIPFKTIQAMAIHSNKVSFLVKTIPYIQVVARRGLSRVVVPEKTALSLAQKKYFARVKAVLSVFPLHQLLLADQGRAASLREGLCGFASWFKTFLVQQLPIPLFHIPSWCLTPHLDPDSLALKLSQYAAQGSSETAKPSTHIIRDSASGRFLGKVTESEKPHIIQVNGCVSQMYGSKENGKRGNLGAYTSEFVRLEPVKALVTQGHTKTTNVEVLFMNGTTNPGFKGQMLQKDKCSENVYPQLMKTVMTPSTVQNNGPLCSNSIISAEKISQQNTSLRENVLPADGNINSHEQKEESRALYLLSAVRSALDSKQTTGNQPYASTLPLPLPYHEKGCTCKGTCRQMECPCARGGVLCRGGQTCSCEGCDNPLNVLHVLNLDIHTARVDECLMQNLYSLNMSELCKVLVSVMVLPCCGNTMELLHLIPGTMLCKWCGTAVSFSWCTRYIHLQTLYPRNHCLACCYCKPTFHTHCQVCLQCTLSTGQGICSKCGTPKPFGV